MNNQRILGAVLLITVLLFIVELVGGFMSNSLALLSDAGHMLTDTLALTLALLASLFAALPATQKRTFGFYRLEILSALLNGSVLTIIALFIFYEAFLRLVHPAPIQSTIMLIVATIGLLGNIGGAVILAGASRENLNVRGAFLHVLSDAVSSVGVIVGGVLIHFFGWYYADPILGFLIGILILRGAFTLISESANVLLEATPKGLKLDDVVSAICSVKGIKDIHDLHVWSITSGINTIAAHLVIEDADAERTNGILREVRELLSAKFNIMHSTFQTECESCPEELFCHFERPESAGHHEH
ncbi:MAG: cation diffusion facilitator family transporter [Candidatus Margulisbacteria bacterium]|nr:cation diffusion facilitator family transporter [Candidatus Margulisiibacteriota bacterium]